PVDRNKRSSLHILQMRELLDREHSSAVSKLHILSVVILDNLRMDVLSGEIHHSIHMGDQADGRLILIAGSSRDLRVEITHVIELHFFNPYVFQLLHKKPAQIKLSLRRRNGLAGLVTCGPDTYIL